MIFLATWKVESAPEIISLFLHWVIKTVRSVSDQYLFLEPMHNSGKRPTGENAFYTGFFALDNIIWRTWTIVNFQGIWKEAVVIFQSLYEFELIVWRRNWDTGQLRSVIVWLSD